MTSWLNPWSSSSTTTTTTKTATIDDAGSSAGKEIWVATPPDAWLKKPIIKDVSGHTLMETDEGFAPGCVMYPSVNLDLLAEYESVTFKDDGTVFPPLTLPLKNNTKLFYFGLTPRERTIGKELHMLPGVGIPNLDLTFPKRLIPDLKGALLTDYPDEDFVKKLGGTVEDTGGNPPELGRELDMSYTITYATVGDIVLDPEQRGGQKGGDKALPAGINQTRQKREKTPLTQAVKMQYLCNIAVTAITGDGSAQPRGPRTVSVYHGAFPEPPKHKGLREQATIDKYDISTDAAQSWNGIIGELTMIKRAGTCFKVTRARPDGPKLLQLTGRPDQVEALLHQKYPVLPGISKSKYLCVSLPNSNKPTDLFASPFEYLSAQNPKSAGDPKSKAKTQYYMSFPSKHQIMVHVLEPKEINQPMSWKKPGIFTQSNIEIMWVVSDVFIFTAPYMHQIEGVFNTRILDERLRLPQPDNPSKPKGNIFWDTAYIGGQFRSRSVTTTNTTQSATPGVSADGRMTPVVREESSISSVTATTSTITPEVRPMQSPRAWCQYWHKHFHDWLHQHAKTDRCARQVAVGARLLLEGTTLIGAHQGTPDGCTRQAVANKFAQSAARLCAKDWCATCLMPDTASVTIASHQQAHIGPSALRKFTRGVKKTGRSVFRSGKAVVRAAKQLKRGETVQMSRTGRTLRVAPSSVEDKVRYQLKKDEKRETRQQARAQAAAQQQARSEERRQKKLTQLQERLDRKEQVQQKLAEARAERERLRQTAALEAPSIEGGETPAQPFSTGTGLGATGSDNPAPLVLTQPPPRAADVINDDGYEASPPMMGRSSDSSVDSNAGEQDSPSQSSSTMGQSQPSTTTPLLPPLPQAPSQGVEQAQTKGRYNGGYLVGNKGYWNDDDDDDDGNYGLPSPSSNYIVIDDDSLPNWY